MNITTKFGPKDRVIIDGDADLVATVTVVRIHPDSSPVYTVEWMAEGDVRSANLDEFRLTLA